MVILCAPLEEFPEVAEDDSLEIERGDWGRGETARDGANGGEKYEDSFVNANQIGGEENGGDHPPGWR